jgi:hypothetical protein
MMNIDPNKIAALRKRSSLKQPVLFPSGMSYEEFMARNTKKLQWDTKVEIAGIPEESTTGKFKESQAHFQDLVLYSFLIVYQITKGPER